MVVDLKFSNVFWDLVSVILMAIEMGNQDIGRQSYRARVQGRIAKQDCIGS